MLRKFISSPSTIAKAYINPDLCLFLGDFSAYHSNNSASAFLVSTPNSSPAIMARSLLAVPTTTVFLALKPSFC